MILLHNSQGKESREFYLRYKDNFDLVINYPQCAELYSDVNKFPAVVYTVPKKTINNSLYTYITNKYPNNYRKIVKKIGDIFEQDNKIIIDDNIENTKQILNYNIGTIQVGCGATIKEEKQILWIKEYAISKGWDENKILYLVEAANLLDFPAYFIRWQLENHNDFEEYFIEYFEDLNEATKSRSTKALNEDYKLIEIIPAKEIILYPTTYENLMEQINELS